MTFTKDFDHIKNDTLTKVGEYTYGNPAIGRAYGGCKLEIGKFCSLAAGIQFVFWGKHSMVDISTYPFNILPDWPPVQCTEVLGEDIYVGNDVWIANNALIMQGAYIGDGAVIGAHSVVKTKVEPYTVVAGNPAQVIRHRFEPLQIIKLMEMKWWDWDIETIKKHLHLISSPKIDELYDIWLNEIK
jgi:acetyltransferase-like isoleucine patch superfamily enzyme